MHISTAKTLQTLKDKANIIIEIKHEVAYGLSISTFRFYLGAF